MAPEVIDGRISHVDYYFYSLQPFFDQLNRFQKKTLVLHYDVKNENLMNIFNTLNSREKIAAELSKPEIVTDNGFNETKPTKNKQSTLQTIASLLGKRFLHFRRNYRLLICLLVLPTLFQIIAMFFMTIRPPGEHDKALEFSTDLYKGSAEFYTRPGSGSDFQVEIDSNLLTRCLDRECFLFNSSEDAFRWILETSNDFAEQRYGGLTARKEKHFIWYNNKGYHSMPVWLNMLDSAMLKAELENTNYSIRTINHPLRIEEDELTISSM